MTPVWFTKIWPFQLKKTLSLRSFKFVSICHLLLCPSTFSKLFSGESKASKRDNNVCIFFFELFWAHAWLQNTKQNQRIVKKYALEAGWKLSTTFKRGLDTAVKGWNNLQAQKKRHCRCTALGHNPVGLARVWSECRWLCVCVKLPFCTRTHNRKGSSTWDEPTFVWTVRQMAT